MHTLWYLNLPHLNFRWRGHLCVNIILGVTPLISNPWYSVPPNLANLWCLCFSVPSIPTIYLSRDIADDCYICCLTSTSLRYNMHEESLISLKSNILSTYCGYIWCIKWLCYPYVTVIRYPEFFCPCKSSFTLIVLSFFGYFQISTHFSLLSVLVLSLISRCLKFSELIFFIVVVLLLLCLILCLFT